MPEPRIGVAYDVFGNGKTAVRANFGVHRALLDTLDYRLDQTAPFNTTLSFSNTTVDKLASLASGTTTGSGQISPSNVQPDIATPTVLAWTFKIEQQIAPATSLTIGYVGSHGYHQILSEDQNTPATVTCPAPGCPAALAPGTVFYPSTTKANPNVANTTSWVSQGISNYNGLEVDVRRQLSHGLQLRGVYTFASNLDDGSAWNTSVSANTPAFVMYPGNPGLDYGPAATNIRHAGAINGTWELPFSHGLLANPAAKAVSWMAGRSAASRPCRAVSHSRRSWATTRPATGIRATRCARTLLPALTGRSMPRQCSSGSILPPSLRPTRVRLGTSGRDTLTGPGLSELDFALAKSTTIHERLRAQFRAEFFNVLNHSNFTTPNPVVYSSGPTPKTPTAEAAQSPTAGVISATATTSRQIQFGLKLLF